jgi:hypothetical protein
MLCLQQPKQRKVCIQMSISDVEHVAVQQHMMCSTTQSSCVCAVRPCLRLIRSRSVCQPVRAQQSSEIGTAGLAAAAAGIVAAPICLLSEYTLATTGAGLPPGPGATLCCMSDVNMISQEPCAGHDVDMHKCVTSWHPGGLFGAAEGVSYLVIVGIVAWSLYTKSQTGSGLPAGPSGLLGAAEGFSFLSLGVGIVVAALQALK